MVFIFQFQHVLRVMALRYAIRTIKLEKIRQTISPQKASARDVLGPSRLPEAKVPSGWHRARAQCGIVT